MKTGIMLDICDEIDIELDVNNKKAIAILTDFVSALFETAEPNIFEYKHNYAHYICVVNVVLDYLIKQDKTINEVVKKINNHLERT